MTIKMSYTDYQKLPRHATHLREWVDGTVIEHKTPAPMHQQMVDYLGRLLTAYARYAEAGEVLSAPLEMRCRLGGNARQPDVVFVSKINPAPLEAGKLGGPAEVVVEVVGDDSVKRDYEEKWKEYQADGVQEYWIIDPRPGQHKAFFFQRQPSGAYKLIQPEAGIYHSAAFPGFWLRLAWLWERPEPQMIFAEIIGFTQMMEKELRAKGRLG